jgi:hypothetical protein
MNQINQVVGDESVGHPRGANVGRKWDGYLVAVVVFGFILAFFFAQGMPLWDDDFTSWAWKVKDKTLLQTFLEILSPISTQPQFWGFNERPIQALLYQLFYRVSGYDSWSYYLYKDLIYGALGGMIYIWGRRLTPPTTGGKIASAAAAIFFMVAPGPIEAHIMHQDLATTAELLFLILTYFMWSEVEKTPGDWTHFPSPRHPEQRHWMVRWFILSFLVYLGYKSKADLKLIPLILTGYILVTRRKQWRLFAWPIPWMLLLAVPWGFSIFKQLPPFVPGSQGSPIGWMFQPASFSRVKDFIWISSFKDWFTNFSSPTLSIPMILGPYLLLAILGFVFWQASRVSGKFGQKLESPRNRAWLFAAVWFLLILTAASALPEINYFFRIRYGILPLVPMSLLLAWVFGRLADASARMWKVVVGVCVLVVVVQVGINFRRSVSVRRSLGPVMVSVDDAYQYFSTHSAYSDLTLVPEFNSYDYRPDAPESIRRRVRLNNLTDLDRGFVPFRTYVIGWEPSLWEKVEVVERFTGCSGSVLFDRIFPCELKSGTVMMRYIGVDPLFAQGEELRKNKDFAGARKLHEEFLNKYPRSMAGLFVVGLESIELKDWERARQTYSVLKLFMPDHANIGQNYNFVLSHFNR